MKPKNMNVELAKEISKKYPELNINADVYFSNGEAEFLRFNVWAKDLKEAKKIRKEFNLGRVQKRIYGGSPALSGRNFTLWSNTACQVVGYKEKIIPEHIEKTAIYKCD